MKKILFLNHRYWLIPVAVWTALVLSSLVWNFTLIERQVAELSASQGREVFRLMEALRLWNARHGGVFVLQTPETPPNPYLVGTEREAEITDGRRLTLVNPAYMTRQVAETFYELTNIRVRITSLKPINPNNAPDAWESAALQAFDHGRKEWAEVVQQNGRSLARFIAPLVTRQACLECHARQGYKVGDIRGGISVSFPTAPFEASVGSQKRSVVLVHGVGWALVTLLTLSVLQRYREQVLDLARGRDALEAEVELRTTELRREVAERHQAENQLRLLVESSGNGLFGLSAGGECTFINPVAVEILGAESAARFLGRPILEMIVPVENHLQRVQDALRLGQSLYSDEVAFERLDGHTFPVEIRLDPIDSDGPAGAVVNFSDITHRKAAEASIWRQANYDVLTGLANRTLFRERLDQALTQARHSGEMMALFFLDLDGFKAINDRYGHEAGDVVLQQTAQRLVESVRQSDLPARQSGDEFLVLLRNLGNREQAGMVAEKLLAAISLPIDFEGQSVRVSASLGIALYPSDADQCESLIRCADLAMYQAKEAGKQAYRYYSSGSFVETRPAG